MQKFWINKKENLGYKIFAIGFLIAALSFYLVYNNYVHRTFRIVGMIGILVGILGFLKQLITYR